MHKTWKWIGCLTAMVMGATPAHAQETRMESVVVVEASGDNATEARDIAIAKAEQEGFKLLLQRVAPDSAESIIAVTPEKRIRSMVKGFEVLNEQISSTTYRAKMKMTYDASMVNEVLAAPDTFAQAKSLKDHVLVLPVLKQGSNLQLWEDSNYWRGVWNSVGLEVGRGTIVLPYGDQQDKMLVDAFMASSASYSRLDKLAARYGAKEVIIVQAAPSVQAGTEQVEVSVRTVAAQGEDHYGETYTGSSGESTEALVYRAARAVAAAIKHQYSPNYASQITPGSKKVMLLAALGNDVAQWIALRKQLLSMPVVEKLELKALSARQADMVVYYRGEPALFVKHLIAQNITVSPTGEYWTIAMGK